MGRTTNERLAPKAIERAARKAYAAEKGDGPFLPGPAKAKLAKSLGVSAASIASKFDRVYFEENGRRAPIVPKASTVASIAAAVKARRNEGGTLARWDSIAASLSTGTGRAYSAEKAKALYASARGTDPDSSYVGRGTRVGAPRTRESALVEVEEALS